MIQIIYNKSVNVIVRKFKTLNKIDSQRGLMDLKNHISGKVYGPMNQSIEGIDVYLKEKANIETLGYEFMVLETPGHTLDHIAFYCKQFDVLFFEEINKVYLVINIIPLIINIPNEAYKKDIIFYYFSRLRVYRFSMSRNFHFYYDRAFYLFENFLRPIYF